MDPRIQALFQRQSYDAGMLFHRFVERHPTVEVDVDNWDWPEDMMALWKAETAAFDAKCQEERDSLADVLGIPE